MAGLQIGAEPGHSELFVQSCPHVWVVVLQIGLSGVQFELSTHLTHVFVVGSQMGADGGHCVLSAHVAVQVFETGSHTGASPGQSAPVVQPTHVFVPTSQTGVGATHAVLFVAVHWTQMPSGSLHAGAALVQFASLVHPCVHWWVVVLQTPFVPEHCVSSTHTTHLFATVSQTGVAPVHAVAFVASHSTQLPDFAPEERHAGSAAA